MVRSILPRLPILRAIVPRVSVPLLPTTALRPTPSLLTNTPRYAPSRLFHYSPTRLSTPNPPSSPHSSPDPRTILPPDASLSQRLKHLIKSYGWYALGVYIVLTVLDFGVAFVGVNLLGAEYVSHVTANVKATIAAVLHSKPAEPGLDEMEPASSNGDSGQEGLYAMIVLAYTIHKTLFFPVRVGLTAALTPRLVGWLTRRGWAGGAGTKRAATEMRERLRERRNRGSQS
ncbi:hypothetical protein BDQ12DRAFT_26994 [Crucibulum laeve]|uniref:DUF1279 domain-containing protein n=1 Tax=Crucibulum laeve TaxID=68775 RepID=A0A5C3MIV5_9AGAR|nr:hypothetical protein BDQ12DRAFT_26994 [Crucibulum laeve]